MILSLDYIRENVDFPEMYICKNMEVKKNGSFVVVKDDNHGARKIKKITYTA